MNKVIYTGGLLLCLLALGGCCSNSESDHRHEHETEGEHEHEGHGDEIIFHKEKAEAAGIEVSTVKSGTFYQVLQTSGEIMAAQGTKNVSSISVRHCLFQTKIVEGMKVGAGSMLLRLSSNNIADGDPVQKAKVAYETSQKEFNRMQVLVKSKIVSEKEFNTARQNYETAKISYESLASGHPGTDKPFRHPYGYIKNILVKEGDYVSTDSHSCKSVRTVDSSSKLRSQKRIMHICLILPQPVSKTAYNPKVYSWMSWTANCFHSARALTVVLFYTGNIWIWQQRRCSSGSYVEVYLQSSPIENTIAIPQSALTEEQGIYYVYLQLDEEAIRQTGSDAGNR